MTAALETARAAGVKSPITLVRITLDACARENGAAPCAAATPCHYTYSTCRDTANYSKSSRVYKFVMNDGPALAGCYPYLKEFHDTPSEIRESEHVTRRRKVTFKFMDDKPHPLAAADKTTSPVESAGTFFKNLKARNRYYPGRTVEVLQGYDGLAEADFDTIFKGVLTDWSNNPGGAEIEAKDLTSVLDKKIPIDLSDTNVLTAIYNGGTELYPVDVTEFPDSGTLLLGSELVTWDGRDLVNGRLENCVAGAFGTTAVSHAIGTAIAVWEVFCTDDPDVGLLAGEALLTLLSRGGLDPLDVATRDLSLATVGAIADHDILIPFTGDGTQLYDLGGVIRMEDELAIYSAISGDQFSITERGAFGTTAAAHDNETTIEYLEPDFEFNNWLTGCRVKRIYESPVTAAEMLEEFCESTGLKYWQGEDLLIHVKLMAGLLYDDDPAAWTETCNIIEGSQWWNDGEKNRVTRTTIYYAPSVNDPGEDTAKYAHRVVDVLAEQESSNAFGELKGISIFAPWLLDQNMAVAVVSRYLIRYSPGEGTLELRVADKDAGTRLGNFVRVSSGAINNPP